MTNREHQLQVDQHRREVTCRGLRGLAIWVGWRRGYFAGKGDHSEDTSRDESRVMEASTAWEGIRLALEIQHRYAQRHGNTMRDTWQQFWRDARSRNCPQSPEMRWPQELISVACWV